MSFVKRFSYDLPTAPGIRRPARPAVPAPKGRPRDPGPDIARTGPAGDPRRRLVAGRGHLPDLPPQLRRFDGRRGGGPAGDRRPPGPPWPGRAGRGCDLALADLPVAGARPGLRRLRSRGDRSAVRLDGRLRGPRGGGPPTGGPGGPRPGHEPHQRPAPVVPGLPWRPERFVRRLVPVARPGRPRPARPAQAAQQLAVILRWLGLDLGRGPAEVLLPQVPGRAARPQLAEPGRAGRPAGDGPRLAGSWRRRLPARCLQHLLQARRLRRQPARPPPPPGVGPPAAHLRPEPAGARRLPRPL